MRTTRPHPGQGLSPRVRGNLACTKRRSTGIRSIPACTGKPTGRTAHGFGCWVYPRVYGETDAIPDVPFPDGGLSPRVRGNLGSTRASVLYEGSIPACTGKPCCTDPPARKARVYPRVYGETRRCASGEQERPGSIPACTGKPLRHYDPIMQITECQRSIDPTPVFRPCVGSGATRAARPAGHDGANPRQL